MEDVIEKVRKLLALSKSSNVNEAANAAKMAQKLMAKHAIEEAMLDESDPAEDEDIEDDLLSSMEGSRIASWKSDLGYYVSRANGCRTYHSRQRRSSRIHIVGRPSDAAKARYMFAYLRNTIDELAKAASKERGNPGRTWVNSFRRGAASEVGRRMMAAIKEAQEEARELAAATDRVQETSTALVRVNAAIAKVDAKQADAKTWMDTNLNLRTRSASSFTVDSHGYAAGKRAGASIDLSSGGRAGLGSGNRKALKG